MNPQTPTNIPPNSPQPPPQPVAYDTEGRPLYAAPHPPTQPQPAHQPPQVVHVTRAVEPFDQEITPEVKAKHDESMRHFPFLNLSDQEFVISAVRRHPIGLAVPVLVTGFLLALVFAGLFNYEAIMATLMVAQPPSYGSVLIAGGLFALLIALGGYIAIWVYMNNKFFLTNESVIQEIQTSLLARHEQTVSLANIEDASYQQHGLIQTLLDYGSIRLSTEGDETTYRFQYVSNPKRQIAILNNAVEAFKNGRPVDINEEN